MAVDLLAVGLTSPLQLRLSAMIMPAIPLIYALFMPWNSRAHLIAVGWTTVAALLLAFALERSGVDPVSPIVMAAFITGAISVVGQVHRLGPTGSTRSGSSCRSGPSTSMRVTPGGACAR